jgi:hypothetical protein
MGVPIADEGLAIEGGHLSWNRPTVLLAAKTYGKGLLKRACFGTFEG